jgi:divinyl chlorophyllide a 8-vinyl-reductase
LCRIARGLASWRWWEGWASLGGMGSGAKRVLVLGATGTIGRATTRALIEAGHAVTCLVRPRAGPRGAHGPDDSLQRLAGATVRFGDATDRASLVRNGIAGERFDALISCLASRTGVATDAWAIDRDAQRAAIAAASDAGIAHFVLLSAICVQKPRLAFQHAKLAAEAALVASGLRWSIVRPTAYFKSLSGQVERVRAGKPYLLFGDGRLTACKPISDGDLGRYVAGCLDDAARWNRVLPVGGPGPAITPREQGEALFALLGQPARFRHVPVGLLDTVAAALGAASRLVPRLATKAELARIGRYYATESMLVLDPVSGRYDPDATPSTGSQTLVEHHARLLCGEAMAERGEHAVF